MAGKKYINRRDAGRQLAQQLGRWKGSDALVFALPNGGVPVGVTVARVLALPLDLLTVRKIAAPLEPEHTLGTIVDGIDPDIAFDASIVRRLGISQHALEDLANRELIEIEHRRSEYGQFYSALEPAGRPAIIVDDELSTGETAKAAVRALRRRGATRVIVAVPVAPADAVAELKAAGAEVVCPRVVEKLFNVAAHYRDFHKLSTADVASAFAETTRRCAQAMAPYAATIGV